MGGKRWVWLLALTVNPYLVWTEPALGQSKELARLKAELTRLRQELDERDRQLKQEKQENARLHQELNERNQTIARLKKQLTTEQRDDKSLQAELKELRGIVQAPYVHVVLFYLKRDAPDNESEALVRDCQELLGKIPTVRRVWAGPPAKQATPNVAQQDFHVALLVLFDNYDQLKKYLDHPLHKRFVEKHNRYVERVVVHDFRESRP